MYTPTFNEEKDIATLHRLIKAHPLGTWAMLSNGEIVINHIPFLLHADEGEFGTLVGHVARANPAWKDSRAHSISTVVFQGPQGYISPSWYPSKVEHSKVVPTWNYAVVHAQGVVRTVDDQQWLLDHVTELTRTHEGAQNIPWHVADAPAAFVEKLLSAIVGIEIPIDRLVGKWKLGQNRSPGDRQGVVDGLSQNADVGGQSLAALMTEGLAAPQNRS